MTERTFYISLKHVVFIILCMQNLTKVNNYFTHAVSLVCLDVICRKDKPIKLVFYELTHVFVCYLIFLQLSNVL